MSRSTPHPSTRTWPALASALAFGLAACQTLIQPMSLSEQLAPLDVALLQSPGVIEAKAREGDGEAQAAMSIIHAYGLQGLKPDSVAADVWRRRAVSNQRFMPITQYTAAFNGQPSRVNIINVPVQTLSPSQWLAIDACLAELSDRDDWREFACGEEKERLQRHAAWDRAIGIR